MQKLLSSPMSVALILIIFGPNCFQCYHFLLKLDRHKIKHEVFPVSERNANVFCPQLRGKEKVG